MSRVRDLDNSSGDKEGQSTHERMCKLASVSDRRTSDWPFLYSVTDRGITLNKAPTRKKEPVQEIGEALW